MATHGLSFASCKMSTYIVFQTLDNNAVPLETSKPKVSGCEVCLLSQMRARCRQKPQPPHPIYEEMNSKSERRGAGSPQNITMSTSHMETAFPVYSNLGIRQAEDNYYACPRQITHPPML